MDGVSTMNLNEGDSMTPLFGSTPVPEPRLTQKPQTQPQQELVYSANFVPEKNATEKNSGKSKAMDSSARTKLLSL